MKDAEKPKTVDVGLGAWAWSKEPICSADGAATMNDQSRGPQAGVRSTQGGSEHCHAEGARVSAPVHVVPTDDLYPHTDDLTCSCGPAVEQYENAKLVIHNAWDGRTDDEDYDVEGEA